MKIFITAFILFISIVISSQSKKVDRINLLFGQENYRIVERKCNRIIKKEKLDESNIFSLYSSLSSYMLEDDFNYKKLIFSCNQTITILDENKIEFSIASINVSNYKHKMEMENNEWNINCKIFNGMTIWQYMVRSCPNINAWRILLEPVCCKKR